MSLEEDAQGVFEALMWANESRDEPFEISQYDLDVIQKVIKECLLEGFTRIETIRYTRCLEHYNPELEEDIALRRMSKIREVVETRTGRKHAKRM